MEFSELISRARQGDKGARARLYEDYVARILVAVRSRLSGSLRRKYETLDLGHSVFLEVLRDLPRFEDRGERAFIGWLSLKAESKVRQKLRKDLFRRGGRREVTWVQGSSPMPADRDSGPLSRVMRNEREGRLRLALEAVDARHRRVLELRNDDALTFAEVAGWMDLSSAEAARKLYARALLQLRKRLRTA